MIITISETNFLQDVLKSFWDIFKNPTGNIFHIGEKFFEEFDKDMWFSYRV